MEQYPLPDKDYMVLIRCFTYNHEAYIEDALKGFVMQKTNFPFVAVVVDDASTDRTADIIRKYEKEYPDIIKGVYLKENHYSQKKKKAPYIQPWRDRCKYEAICEGDDYWIDPLKLQKQVDFLETDENFGLCYSKSYIYNQKQDRIENFQLGHNFNSFEELLFGNKIPTLTAIYRIDLYKKYIDEINPNDKDWMMGDYPLWLWYSYNSNIKFLNEVTSVYRVLNNSASHFRDTNRHELFTTSIKNIRLYFHNKYIGGNKYYSAINDLFHRENLVFGEKKHLRLYSLKCLKSIKYKKKRDLIKIVLYKTVLGFNLIQMIIKRI